MPREPRKDVFIQPRQSDKPPPCRMGCPNGSNVREWVGTVAQRRKLGLTEDEAYQRAFNMIAAVNPFPAVTGRICPHPCEAGCNRDGKDGAVAVHRLERFIGDWAIERRLPLPRLDYDRKSESIAVVGAGPAGLSFAYQMARRGYPVTIYESHAQPGGMLRYGIPEYRLPRNVLDVEIHRIMELGVEIRLSTNVGRDIASLQLTGNHTAVFLGIGAQRGANLDIGGEDGPGVFTGIEYLSSIHCGRTPDLGDHVVVVGGGDTAIDAARMARRHGVDVTLIYRRSMEEMPAGETDIRDAQLEGVDVECFVTPVRIHRYEHRVRSVTVRRMRAGPRDSDGRHRPVPIEGSEFELSASAVIAAVAQAPDWQGLEGFTRDGSWAQTDDSGRLGENCWAGGDVEGAGIASLAMARGRRAAEELDARLRGAEPPAAAPEVFSIGVGRVKPEAYTSSARSALRRRPVDQWLTRPADEIEFGLSEKQFLEEAGRCLSCGNCFGCERCWMYCAHDCFTRLEEVRPGAYFGLNLEACRACGKCVDVCPCGFLEDR